MRLWVAKAYFRPKRQMAGSNSCPGRQSLYISELKLATITKPKIFHSWFVGDQN